MKAFDQKKEKPLGRQKLVKLGGGESNTAGEKRVAKLPGLSCNFNEIWGTRLEE